MSSFLRQNFARNEIRGEGLLSFTKSDLILSCLRLCVNDCAAMQSPPPKKREKKILIPEPWILFWVTFCQNKKWMIPSCLRVLTLVPKQNEMNDIILFRSWFLGQGESDCACRPAIRGGASHPGTRGEKGEPGQSTTTGRTTTRGGKTTGDETGREERKSRCVTWFCDVIGLWSRSQNDLESKSLCIPKTQDSQCSASNGEAVPQLKCSWLFFWVLGASDRSLSYLCESKSPVAAFFPVQIFSNRNLGDGGWVHDSTSSIDWFIDWRQKNFKTCTVAKNLAAPPPISR